MSRQVITAQDLDIRRGRGPAPMSDMGGAPGAPPIASVTPDDYTARLVKYVPSEVIAVYLTIGGILASRGLTWHWPAAVFGLLLVLTPVYLYRVEGVERRKQLFLSTACFLVWAVSLGRAPFAALDPLVGAILLPLFTFTLPMWDGRSVRTPQAGD